MNTALLVYQKNRALPKGPPPGKQTAIRRVFDNSQLIERFGQWLMVIGKAANTRLSYTLAARQFAQFIEKPLTSITKQDVTDFLGSLYAKNYSAGTMASKLFALRIFFDFLQLGSQVRMSAPRFVATRKVPRRLPRALSEEEVEKVITAAKTPRDLAIVELGYASGLRVTELSMLRIEDVDVKGRSLTVRQGKGGNDRIALFGRRAAEALREYIGQRTNGRLFLQHPHRQQGGVFRDRKYGVWFGQWRETDDNGKRVMRTVRLGDYDIPNRERAKLTLASFLSNTNRLPERGPDTKPLGRKGVYRVIVGLAKRAKIAGVHPHILRHSMATHCLNRGMDIRHVQELLGHTSLVATQKYLHVAIANLQKIHAKFHPHGGSYGKTRKG